MSIGVGYLTKDDHKSQRKVFKDADDMVHVAKMKDEIKLCLIQLSNYKVQYHFPYYTIILYKTVSE